MAEDYTLGLCKIVYRATNFGERLDIFVDLYDPDGLRIPSILLMEMGEGLYWFKYVFLKSGIYSGIFYEDGVKKISQNFRITSTKGLGTFLGNNVINNG